jgi:hypothetical protein
MFRGKWYCCLAFTDTVCLFIFDKTQKLFDLLLFRIKRRTFLEMEQDFPYKKIFDLKMDLKGASFVLPEYGVYQQ